MIARRYVPAVFLLVTLALVPTVIHSYIGLPQRDRVTVDSMPQVVANQIGSPTGRDRGWGQRRLAAFDWAEHRFAGPPEVTLFVGRSFDAKQLYHHPELEIAYGSAFGPATVTRLPQRPDIPVHVLRGRDGNARGLALYVLLYDGEYVESPILFQLQNAVRLLFSRRKPMTLFFARQQLPSADAPASESNAARVLLAAIDAFVALSRTSDK